MQPVAAPGPVGEADEVALGDGGLMGLMNLEKLRACRCLLAAAGLCLLRLLRLLRVRLGGVGVALAAAKAVELGLQSPVLGGWGREGRFKGRHRCKRPNHSGVAAGSQDAVWAASPAWGHVGPARLAVPGSLLASTYDPDVLTGAVEALPWSQRAKGQSAPCCVVQQAVVLRELNAQLLGELPAMAQRAAARALLEVDVAAVLALPDHGPWAGQGKVQVF